MRSILLFLVLLFAVGCHQSSSDILLLERLNTAVRAGEKGDCKNLLNLSAVTDFAWDSVYFFHGEENDKVISWYIGGNWVGPAVPNLNNRLLFTYKRQVVAYVDYIDDVKQAEYSTGFLLPVKLFTCPDIPVRQRGRVWSEKEANFVVEKSKETFFLIPVKCSSKVQNIL